MSPRSREHPLHEVWDLIDARRFGEALAALDKILAAEPDDAAAIDLKGICFLRQEQNAMAEASFRTALEHLPASAPIYVHLGEALARQQREDEALEAYECAVRYDDTYAPGFYCRGRLRMLHLRDAEASLQDLARAVELDPDASESWFTLGLCRLGRQEVEAADADFKRALALDPALEPRVRAVLRDYSIAATDLPEA
ncbi:MAG: hypothetical protein A2X52_01200 [Candidatus Rokubacteria bacterium GWC2_70_16]|nr:MAG: hypothetical protein A2X52_01200 [Candidatus Rokubacteria bacterium GWC2_70_16]